MCRKIAQLSAVHQLAATVYHSVVRSVIPCAVIKGYELVIGSYVHLYYIFTCLTQNFVIRNGYFARRLFRKASL